MNKIYISNESGMAVSLSQRGLIRRAIGQTLRYEKFTLDAEFSVTLTDNENIHLLNYEYRNIDRPTDVLSFPLFNAEEIANIKASPENYASDEPVALGDIVISLEKAESQAREYCHSFEREIAFLCIHSVLHLLGYDHELGEAEEKDMFFRQKEILKKMKLELT